MFEPFRLNAGATSHLSAAHPFERFFSSSAPTARVRRGSGERQLTDARPPSSRSGISAHAQPTIDGEIRRRAINLLHNIP